MRLYAIVGLVLSENSSERYHERRIGVVLMNVNKRGLNSFSCPASMNPITYLSPHVCGKILVGRCGGIFGIIVRPAYVLKAIIQTLILNGVYSRDSFRVLFRAQSKISMES